MKVPVKGIFSISGGDDDWEEKVNDMLELYSGIDELKWILDNEKKFMRMVRREYNAKLQGEAELNFPEEE